MPWEAVPLNVLWTSGTGFDSVQRPVKACWRLLIMKGPVFRHYGPRMWLRYTSIGRVKLFSCWRSQRAMSLRGDDETIGAQKKFSRAETHLWKNIFPTSAPPAGKLSPPWRDLLSDKAAFVIPVDGKLGHHSTGNPLLYPRDMRGRTDEGKKTGGNCASVKSGRSWYRRRVA